MAERLGEPLDLAVRFRRLAAVTGELLAATTVAEVGEIVVGHLVDAAEATVGSLSVVDGTDLCLVAVRGARDGVAERWARYPLAATTPAGDSVRAGRPLVFTGRAELLAAYPSMEMATDGDRTLVCLPLQGSAEALGAVTLSWDGIRDVDAAQLEFFAVCADACAQALTRIGAERDVQLREERLQFLADASAELASSLDYEATLTAVARLAVPDFADWCVIQVLVDGQLRPLALAHPDAFTSERILELQERYPPDPDAPRGAYQVIRSGEPELINDITDDMLAEAATDAEHLQILRDLHFRSAVSAPLRVRDRVLGVISWVTGASTYRYTSADLEFLEDLARRAAVAIDNAELHSQLRDLASRLQRAVLPARLPQPDGWAVAAHYSAAGRTDAGGDFYDVVVLPDGRIAVFVGDVMGRGVKAASTMAQMRAAIRTLIAQDPAPEEVMDGLDRMFTMFDPEQLVTVVYGLVETPTDGTARLRLVSAGHPSPLLRRADGTSQVLAPAEPLLLGVGGGQRQVTEVAVGHGDTVLMFTDGLIERRDEALDDGEERLAAAAADLDLDDLVAGLPRVVDQVRDPNRDDDVAVVALHRR
jgi:transcriptional regulator with GAF, ATPase, and Fis domain